MKMRILAGMLAASVVLPAAAHESHHHAAAPANAACAKAAPALACAGAPSAVFDAQGRLFLAWAQGGRVVVARSDDLGRTTVVPVAVNGPGEGVDSGGDERPKIAMGTDGAILVTYTRKLAKPYTGHVMFSRSTDGGAVFEAPRIVNDDRAIVGHGFDTLGVAPDGSIYVAWIDKRDQVATKTSPAKSGNQGVGLYVGTSSDGGKTFSPNVRLAQNSCECCRVALAFDPDGLPAVLWRHVYPGSIRDHALTKFEARLVPGEIRRVSHDNWHLEGCPHHGPSLAIAASGIYHMAWFDDGADGKGLFYARSSDQGRHVGVPLSFGTYDRQAGHASVAAQGRAVWLAWTEFDGEATRLMVMRSADEGQHFEPPTMLSRTLAAADHPFLVANGERMFVSWMTGEGYRLLAVAP